MGVYAGADICEIGLTFMLDQWDANTTETT